MDRRLVQFLPSAATATFALAAAGWAATGDVPLAGGDARQPLAVAAQATGPLVADDHDGSAVLTAPAMAPGATEAGDVTISNAGDAAGTFSLAAGSPADRGGPAGGLSALLDLTVSDVSNTAPITLYAGKLSAFRGLGLGTLDAGAARRYRFAVTYPAGRPAALDDPYQGASTSLDLAWTAAAVAAAPAPVPDPAPAAPPPAAPTPAAGAPAAAPAAPAQATPAPALTVTLGPASKPVSRGRLVTWLQSSTTAIARVTGTVSYAGKRATLHPASVKLAAGKRTTVRLRLPAAALAPKRRLTVRLSVSATAGARTTVVKRTLRATAP